MINFLGVRGLTFTYPPTEALPSAVAIGTTKQRKGVPMNNRDSKWNILSSFHYNSLPQGQWSSSPLLSTKTCGQVQTSLVGTRKKMRDWSFKYCHSAH